MYKCKDCDKEFKEPRAVHTTYESYYGVYGDFPNTNPMTYYCCPYCHSEEIEEVEEDEE